MLTFINGYGTKLPRIAPNRQYFKVLPEPKLKSVWSKSKLKSEFATDGVLWYFVVNLRACEWGVSGAGGRRNGNGAVSRSPVNGAGNVAAPLRSHFLSSVNFYC